MKAKLMVIVAVLIASFCWIQTGNACSPPPVAVLTAEPDNTVIGVNVVFDGNSSYTPDDEIIVKYEWDFDGDGTYDYYETADEHSDGLFDGITTHAYSSSGTYTARLRVTDNRWWFGEWSTGTDTATITIKKVIYVDCDATGNNDGTTWANAYNDLQDALADADSDNEIWVAEGTYKPGTLRADTFQLVTGVEVYGGFDPTIGDDTWAERAWVNNVTTLSGDIGTVDNTNDNCYHVVKSINSDSYTTLDGFTITRGNANGTDSNSCGGGIYCEQSKLAITNCVITKNTCQANGGGVYIINCADSNIPMTNCIISENEAAEGGGVYDILSFPTWFNCIMYKNTAGNGGALYNDYFYGYKLINCTLTGNESYATVQNYRNTNYPDVVNCIFWDNNDLGGRDIYNETRLYWPQISYCNIEGCSSSEFWSYGGDDCGGNIDENPNFAGVVDYAIYSLKSCYEEEWDPWVEHIANCNVVQTSNELVYSTTQGNWLPTNTHTDLRLNVQGESDCEQWERHYRVKYRVWKDTVVKVKTYTAGWTTLIDRTDVFRRQSPTYILINGTPQFVDIGAYYDVEYHYWGYSYGGRGGVNWGENYLRVYNVSPEYFDVESYVYNHHEYDGYQLTYVKMNNYIENEGGSDGMPLYLRPDSPCIDAANGNVDPDTDILGNSRYDDPNTPNTGTGDPDYVDMGAYEYQP